MIEGPGTEPAPEAVIHWFRRDLRLVDNTALDHALLSGARVIPVFLLDERILQYASNSPLRLHFLRTALEDLDARLRERGSALLVRRADDVVRELNRIAQETGAWGLYFNRDYSPYARARDTRATRGMQMIGVLTMAFDDLLLVPPFELLDDNAEPPAAFDDFLPRWYEALDVAPTADDRPQGLLAQASDLPPGDEPPDAAQRWGLAPGRRGPSPWPGATPADAMARLEAFVQTGLEGFGDSPAQSSRLSAALKFGTISPRQVAAAALARGAASAQTGASPWGGSPTAAQVGVQGLVEALAHRDHAFHGIFASPRPLGDGRVPPSWAEGRTGVPLVDAAMRQVAAEGWAPPGPRAYAAAHLVHSLGGTPEAGARHFQTHLLDADVALNSAGWQSVLTPAERPRPATLDAAEAIDPRGAYVRRWVQELWSVPAEHIHQPWRMTPAEQELAKCIIGRDYPARVGPGG